jgi:hypothetical protein
MATITPTPTSPQHSNSLETLIQTYAEMALAGGDQALKDGRRDYLLQRFAELDQDFPGLRSMIIQRIRQIK